MVLVDPLTVTVATVLATKALERVGEEAGRSACSGIGRLTGLVRRKLARDPQANTVLERAQESPDNAASIERLAEVLQGHIEQDPGFSHELAAWVEEARRHPILGGFVTHVAEQAQVGTIIAAQIVQGSIHVGAPQPAPLAVPAAPAAPAQLPPNVAEFTGRETELARLRALVSERAPGRQTTLVISAIVGMAGVGKTALAVYLAHELTPRFPDGQLYVNLHGYDPRQRLGPAQVLERFLRALGVADTALPTSMDEQASLYRTLMAGKHALVVLDNVASADQVRPLLPGSSTCLVLVTSRDALVGLVAQDGARLFPLDVLTPEESVELLARIAGHDRLAREPQAATEVARSCGYLPLAVRIVGAKLAYRPGWTLANFARRLADEQRRLHELAAGDVQVRASFALSYRELAPATARVFRRLGLIAGPDFAASVIAALADTTVEDAAMRLEALVNAHLVEAAATPGRYRLHDLLRLYAREQVKADEAEPARHAALERALGWYLAIAEYANEFLMPTSLRGPGADGSPFPDQQAALAWLEAERANLVAAAKQAAEHMSGAITVVAWQLSDALCRFFDLRKYWADWQAVSEAALRTARRTGNPAATARQLSYLGIIATEQRRFKEASAYQTQSLAICRDVGDRDGEARALNSLGIAYWQQWHLDEAVTYFEHSLALCREIGDREGEDKALNNLGSVFAEQRRFDEAIACLERSLAISRKIGGSARRTLNSLGDLYRSQGRVEEAIACYEQSLVICRQAGDRHTEALNLRELGLAIQAVKGLNAARAYWGNALAIFMELGAPEADEVRALLEGKPDSASTTRG